MNNIQIQIMSYALKGAKYFLQQPLNQAINRKLKNNQSQASLQNYFHISNLINPPPFVQFKNEYLFQEEISRLQGIKLKQKYFSNITQSQKMYADIQKYQLVFKKFVEKYFHDKEKPKYNKLDERQTFINEFFKAYRLQNYQQEEIARIIGDKPKGCLHPHQNLTIHELFLQFYSSIQSLCIRDDFIKILEEQEYQKLYKSLQIQNKYDQNQVNSEKNLFFQAEILSNSFIKQLKNPSPNRSQWPRQFIEKEKKEFISNQITGRHLYVIQQVLNQLRQKFLVNHQFELKQLFKNTLRNYKNPNRFPSKIQKRQLKDQLKKDIRRCEKPTIQYIKMQLPKLEPTYISKKLNEINKNIIKFEPQKTNDLDIYCYRKSKTNKSFIKKFQNFKNSRVQYVDGQRIVIQQINFNKKSNEVQQRNNMYKIDKNIQKNLPKINRQKNSMESIYPYRIGSLIVQNSKTSYLLYHLNSIELKELSLRFLIDRQKYGENNVLISVDMARNISPTIQSTLFKALSILDCFGAITTIVNSCSYAYKQYKSKYSTQISICAVILNTSIVQVIKQLQFYVFQ